MLAIWWNVQWWWWCPGTEVQDARQLHAEWSEVWLWQTCWGCAFSFWWRLIWRLSFFWLWSRRLLCGSPLVDSAGVREGLCCWETSSSLFFFSTRVLYDGLTRYLSYRVECDVWRWEASRKLCNGQMEFLFFCFAFHKLEQILFSQRICFDANCGIEIWWKERERENQVANTKCGAKNSNQCDKFWVKFLSKCVE